MTFEQHYEVTLVQADGRWDLENNTNNGDATGNCQVILKINGTVAATKDITDIPLK